MKYFECIYQILNRKIGRKRNSKDEHCILEQTLHMIQDKLNLLTNPSNRYRNSLGANKIFHCLSSIKY